jgi:transcriptional regulator with GAF, ATPase, and Fis domain
MSRRDEDDDRTRTDVGSDLRARMPVPVLIVVGDARTLGRGRAVIRLGGSLEIGRRPDAPAARAWALDDDRVSRRHALLQVDGLGATAQIADLGSRNGTQVDGRVVGREPTRLVSGSMIFIGTTVAIFHFVTEAELEAIAEELASPFTPVATTSPALAARTKILRHLARGKGDLLLVGETGVGKEEFARAIHQASGRAGKFVAINCPALPGTLIESELYGYVKGAHSQASRDKPGLIDEAEGGTLFLDEFAEISQEVQAKLLRFLEDKNLQALGATRGRRVDVRVLAATNRELSALRQDITARLGPEPIRLPPLRNHPEDIGALAAHFLRDRPGMELEVPAFQALCLHGWPDNVRGLRTALARAAELAAALDRNVITLADLPEQIGRPAPPAPPPSVESSEPGSSESGSSESAPPAARRSPRAAPTRADLEALLGRHDWVVSRAAREIDRDPAVVWRWIKRYGLDVGRARQDD